MYKQNSLQSVAIPNFKINSLSIISIKLKYRRVFNCFLAVFFTLYKYLLKSKLNLYISLEHILQDNFFRTINKLLTFEIYPVLQLKKRRKLIEVKITKVNFFGIFKKFI